jgi:hypothetical protein
VATFEDVFGPAQPVELAEPPPADPWSWVPPEWQLAAAAASAPPVTPAEPGASVLEVNQPGIPVPAAALEQAAAQLPPPEPPTMQPGLGIPAEAFDNAMKVEPGDRPVVMPWLQDKLGLPELEQQAALPPEPPPGEDGGYGVEAMSPDPTVNDRVDALLSLDPETRERVMGEQEAEKVRFALDRQREELAIQREAQERNARTYQEAVDRAQKNSESIAAEALALADTKPDRGRWFASRTTGQKIAAFVAAIVGGAYQGRTGGSTNQGLDGIERLINEDVNAQAAELANKKDLLGLRRGMVGEQFGRAGDSFRAAESVRLAAYENVVRDLEAEVQQYDPRGSTARDIARSIADMRARQAAAVAKMTEAERDRQLKIWEAQAKADQDARDLAERERHNRAAEKTENWKVAVDREDKRERRTLDAGKLILDEKKNAAEVQKLEAEARKLEKEGKSVEAEHLRKYSVWGQGQLEVEDDGKTPVLDADGQPVITYKPIEHVNGGAWAAGSEQEKAETIKKIGSAQQVVDIIDEVLTIRDRVGGESSWDNSDDYQRLKVLEANLQLLKKEGTQGMSSDKDMEAIRSALGAADVTSFRARAAGLAEGRERTIASLNGHLNLLGAKPMKFVNKYATRKPETTAEDERFKELTKKPNVSFEDAAQQLEQQMRAREEKQLGRKLYSREITPIIKEARAAAEKSYRDISPKQAEELARLGVSARGTGKEADRDYKRLGELMDRGGTERIRAEAAALLDSINMSRTSSREEAGVSGGTTATEGGE